MAVPLLLPPVLAYNNMLFFLFYFGVIYFRDLAYFSFAYFGLSPLFSTAVGECVECGQYFICPAIVQVRPGPG
jgi:hypothetical protein